MMVRIHFKDMDPEGEGRDDYTFDIQVDAENKPVAGIPFFGIWGQFSDHNNCYPVLLQRNGQIDLGSQADLPAIKKTAWNVFSGRIFVTEKWFLGNLSHFGLMTRNSLTKFPMFRNFDFGGPLGLLSSAEASGASLTCA